MKNLIRATIQRASRGRLPVAHCVAKFITTVLFASMLLAAAPMTAAAVSYNVTDLGALGGMVSEAFGINNAGQVTGGAQTADGQFHAFLYDGTMHDLGSL